MQLTSKMVDNTTGKVYGVYNEKVSGGIMDYYVGPFDTVDECKLWCDEYTDMWRMGYNGRASLNYIDGNLYALCSRWTSCD